MRMYNLAAGALVWWAVLMVLSSLFFPAGATSSPGRCWQACWRSAGCSCTKEPAARPWLRAGVLVSSLGTGDCLAHGGDDLPPAACDQI